MKKRIETLEKKVEELCLSDQDKDDLKQYGFKNTQICLDIKMKLDQMSVSNQKKERIRIFEQLILYMNSPNVKKFINYHDNFKYVSKQKIIEIYTQEPSLSRFLYVNYRNIFNERIPYCE